MKVIPADQAQKQIDLLVSYIKDGTCEEQEWGLCGNVLLDDFDTECFKKWPLFSGNRLIPIEGGFALYHSTEAELNRHNRKHKYGRLRLKLAEFCLKVVLEQVNGGNNKDDTNRY